MTDQHDLAEGDLVPVTSQSRTTVETVQRVTATQFTTVSGRRFRRDSGREIGVAASKFFGPPRATLPGAAGYDRQLSDAYVEEATAIADRAVHEWSRGQDSRRDPKRLQAAITALTALAERLEAR